MRKENNYPWCIHGFIYCCNCGNCNPSPLQEYLKYKKEEEENESDG